jgi:uncharacterized membrane protein YkoI
MNLRGIISAGACAVVAVSALAFQPGDYGKKDGDSKLLAALGKSKHTLEDGIKQAAKGSEVPMSAKFEMEDDEGKNELSLSVYVAEKGLGVDAEHNVFKELGGGPESEAWKPETEVFKDVEHVSRSAEQLTIMALSKLTLQEVVQKAQKDQPGTVYSVTPKMRDRKAVFVVLVANQGKRMELAYDAMTGSAVKK